jgi:hypothetical protein
MSLSNPDIIINETLIRRCWSDFGVVSHYLLRSKRPDGGWQDKMVAAPMLPIMSRHQPMPQRLPDGEEIQWLTRVIKGEEMD